MFVKLFSVGIVVPRPKELLATTLGGHPRGLEELPRYSPPLQIEIKKKT
jgi:hypothetical protein